MFAREQTLTENMEFTDERIECCKTKKKYKNLFAAFLPVLLVLFLLTSCGSVDVKNEDGKITVYTSFYTMYDFALKIGGDKVNVVNMIPPGMEPHDWEPSPKDIAGLSEADLFIYSGAGMEGWVGKVLESIKNDNLIAVETSKEITLESADHAHGSHDGDTGHKTGHSHVHEHDPHVWLNPMNAKLQMKAIKDALIRVDAENSRYYEENYEYYAGKLDELDKKYREAAASFSRKEIVVSHAAYGYLCSAYGLKQVALEGIAGSSEPDAARMAEITKYVRDNDIRVIFYDGISSSKVAEAIARETGAKTEILSPLEGIGARDLEEGKDYFAIMEQNLKVLTDALK